MEFNDFKRLKPDDKLDWIFLTVQTIEQNNEEYYASRIRIKKRLRAVEVMVVAIVASLAGLGIKVGLFS